MADGLVNGSVSSLKEVEKSFVINDEPNQCCAKTFKLLQAMREEIDSLKEIIKIYEKERVNVTTCDRPKNSHRDANSVEVEENKDPWVEVKSQKKGHKTVLPQIAENRPIPVIINRYAMPPNKPIDSNELIQDTTTKNQNYRRPRWFIGKNKRKILVIGDSHARGSSEILQENLTPTFQVTGIVKPGARARDVTNTNVEELTNEDMVILWAGSNDISKNCGNEAIKNIASFANKYKETNIIAMEAPHRYDLPSWSCVNKEVSNFNRKLKKTMKIFSHVTVLAAELERINHTRHGLHFNYSGKRAICRKISEEIQKKLKKKQQPAIPLQDKKPCTQEEDQIDTLIPGAEKQGIRVSTRTRRAPLKLNNSDFL